MSELERYIRANAGAFDTQEAPAGHEARFLALLDASGAIPAEPVRGSSRWRSAIRRLRSADFRRPAAWTFALAALAAAFLLLRPGDPFRKAGNDPAAIYLAYMEQVAGLYGTLPPEDSASWDASLQEVTEEAVPLFEQLPEELSAREQARILKAYYGELLASARQFKNIR